MKVTATGVFAAAALSMATAAVGDTMHAAVVSKGEVHIQQVAIPAPEAGQVRVRVRAAGVNPIDWKMATGHRPQVPPGAAAPAVTGPLAAVPGDSWIPGFDAAGEIESVGAGVEGWKVGDPVIAYVGKRGAYAQYAVVPASDLALKPTQLSFEQAAGIPTAASAAWATLVDSAQVGPGMRVLIHGGAGGVGSSAVQIAKARGAYVIATASKGNHEFLRSIGADETIDYQAAPFESQMKPVDVALNTVNVETATRSIAVVKKGGLVVSVAGPADAEKCAAAGVRCQMRSRDGAPIGTVLAEIASLAAAGRYRVNVDQTFALDDTAKAWEASRAGHTRGKLVIAMP